MSWAEGTLGNLMRREQEVAILNTLSGHLTLQIHSEDEQSALL